MIRTVAGIELSTRPMERRDRGFVVVRMARRLELPLPAIDAMLDGPVRCSVWCSLAHPTTLHGYVVLAHAALVDAFVVPSLKRFGLDADAVAELSGHRAA